MERIVLEIGDSLIRCGIAGTYHTSSHMYLHTSPIFTHTLFRNISDPLNVVVALPLSYSTSHTGEVTPRIKRKQEERTDRFSNEILRRVFFEDMLLNRVQSRDVFLVENYLTPIQRRERLCRTLFERLNVPRVYFINAASAAILACGRDTGIVIDVGFRETRFVPVCHGAIQDFAIRYRPGGHIAIRKHILQNYDIKFSPDELDRFISSSCNVRLEQEEEEEEKEEKESEEVYKTKNGDTINIPQNLKWEACETLFEKDQDGNDFVTTFLDAVMRCPVDVRALIVQNVIVIGGVVASLPNITKRLEMELKQASFKTHPEYSRALACVQKSLTVQSSVVFPTDHIAWTGASILASSENPKLLKRLKSVTRDSYKGRSSVPDEFSLISRDKEE